MHILFVTPTLPIPTSGGRTRLFNLIKQLASRHHVSVLSLIQPSEHDLLHLVEPCCKQIALVPFAGFKPIGKWSNRLRGWRRVLFSQRPQYVYTFPVESMREPLGNLLNTQPFDVVVFEQLFLAELLDQARDVPAVLHEHNVESDIAWRAYLRAANPVHRLRDWLTWRRLLAFEEGWVRRYSVCVAVSDHDAATLREMSPRSSVYVVPNGVDCQAFKPPNNAREPETLLFFGTLSYGPNVAGLLWFCQEVLPRIRESKPGVMLEVIGLDPPSEVLDLGQLPGVQVTGFVPDIRSKLWSATACVVPLHVGGGTRLKILEALAAGCPVISTSIGAEGLALVHEEHLLISDTADQFAHCTLRLLQSPDLQSELAVAGRQAVAQHYDWETIASQFEAALVHSADLRTDEESIKAEQ